MNFYSSNITYIKGKYIVEIKYVSYYYWIHTDIKTFDQLSQAMNYIIQKRCYNEFKYNNIDMKTILGE